jgi:tellurite resistance protein TerC
MDKFHYLKIGLGVVLTFVGVKMLLGHSAWKIDTHVSLAVIILVLGASVAASLMWPKRVVVKAEHPPKPEPEPVHS